MQRVTKVSAREVFDQIFFALWTNSIPADQCLAGSQFCQLNAQVIEALPIRYLGLTGNPVALSLVHPAAKKAASTRN